MASNIIVATTFFYDANSVYSSIQDIENRSIIYNVRAQRIIDDYITKTKNGKKDVYRIVSYDSKEEVPYYLLGNYEWYNYSAYNLCNYSGYEIHLCVPADYQSHIPWFNNYDWEYLSNTRADYMMTDWETINANRDFFDKYINWEKGVSDIGNGRIMVSLLQFVPSNICGENDVIDNGNSFDNGYFYSNDLSNEDIVNFDTNQNSEYVLSVNANKLSEVAFLPYANRNYHYYVDGVEISPKIVNMQAIITLDKGKHEINILYQNNMGTIGFWMIMGSGVAFILGIAFLYVIKGASCIIKNTEDPKEEG